MKKATCEGRLLLFFLFPGWWRGFLCRGRWLGLLVWGMGDEQFGNQIGTAYGVESAGDVGTVGRIVPEEELLLFEFEIYSSFYVHIQWRVKLFAPKSTPNFGDVKTALTIVYISCTIAKTHKYKHMNLYDCSLAR